MLGQIRIGHLQKRGPREQIEKIHRFDLAHAAVDTLCMLMGFKLGITIAQGWPRGCWRVMCSNNILPISAASLPLRFQSLSPSCQYRCALSQCHSGIAFGGSECCGDIIAIEADAAGDVGEEVFG